MRRLHRRGQRGQSLVEFALVLPVFMAILFAVVDGARLVYTANTVSQAAREGARTASVQASYIGATPPCGAPVCPASSSAFRSNVTAAVNRMTVGLDTIASSSVALTCADYYLGSNSADCVEQNETGNSVTVRVDYTYAPVTPVLAQLFPAWSLTASATMTIH